MITLQEEPSSLTISYKYIRRADISSALRLKLGILLAYFKHHGQVTNFAKKYGVSRTFLYNLEHAVSAHLSSLFTCVEVSENSSSSNRYRAWEEILKLRLIGKCSLSAISTLLASKDERLPNSTCFISQFLKQLGSRLGKMVDWQGEVVFASDEIFMVGHQPVLVTVDPVSSVILRMECLDSLSKEAWEKHWKSLIDAGIIPLGIVKDEGVAMNAAQAAGVMSQVDKQTDTFHAVSHRLGLYAKRLEKAVDKAMEYEWERKDKIQSAVSEAVLLKRVAMYEEACQKTLLAIEQFEGFQFLYFHILRQFNAFDSKGQARSQTSATEEVRAALEMMRDLQISGLNEQLDTINNLVPELFNFLPKAQVIQYQLEAELGEVPTYFWTYAWQMEKKSRKIKHYAKSQSAARKSKTALDLLQEHYQLSDSEFHELKTKIFSRLDRIVQSSALVETINSLLRPYMNEAKNQLSQEQLNLIRFYLNHRVYQRGKRKGAAPIELLSGQKMEKTWREMLLKLA